MKKNKGITLIVLVITIIVMSILIGVSIRLVAGKKGLIARSKTTKEETLRQQALEVIEKEVRSSIDELGEYDINEAIENINSNYSERITELVQSTDKRIGLKFKHQDYEFSFVISNKGEVTAVSEYIYEKETAEEDIYELLAPVPIGFVASDYIGTNDGEEELVNVKTVELDANENVIEGPEDTGKIFYDGEDKIEHGLVIYEGNKKVDESNLEEAQETRNQFVWIPVKEEDLNSILVTDENGDLYYCEEIRYPGSPAKDFLIIEPYHTLKDYIGNIKLEDYENTIKSLFPEMKNSSEIDNMFNDMLRRKFNETLKSVRKFGGFYISRYELGLKDSKLSFIKGNEIFVKNSSNNGSWYKNIKLQSTSNNRLFTENVYGFQWKLMRIFLDKKVIKYEDFYIYFYSDFDFREIKYMQKIKNVNNKTGQNEENIVGNIYDLLGSTRITTQASVVNYLEFEFNINEFEIENEDKIWKGKILNASIDESLKEKNEHYLSNDFIIKKQNETITFEYFEPVSIHLNWKDKRHCISGGQINDYKIDEKTGKISGNLEIYIREYTFTTKQSGSYEILDEKTVYENNIKIINNEFNGYIDENGKVIGKTKGYYMRNCRIWWK